MSTSRRLVGALRPYSGLFGLGLLGEFIASTLDGLTVLLLVPLLKLLFGTAGALDAGGTALEPLIDRLVAPLIAGATPGQAAGRIVVLLLTALVVKNVISVGARQASAYVEEGLVRDLRVRLFRHLLTLDLGFFQRTRVGQVVAGLVTDTDAAKMFVPTVLATGFRNLVMILALLAVLVGISWRLTLLTLATAPVLVLGVRVLSRYIKRHSREWARERGDLTAGITERLGAVKLIRAYGREDRELGAFEGETDRYRRRVVRTHRWASFPSPVSEVFGGMVIILIVWASMKPALVGAALGPTMTIVFLITALRIMSPLKAIAQVPAAMAMAVASAERVFELLDQPAGEADPPGAQPAAFERELVFDRVGFRYEPDGEPVLQDVSFRVGKGRVLAIVGPSGAGKTTLLDLVPRFYDPTEGAILLDGVPLTRLSRRSLRALIGVVGQETVLLNDTVFANIAYGRPDATPRQVEAAAAAANATEFIGQLPQGYQTMLGERGMRLSGGQRQRIAIARALLRDPPILILDEATSALDTESERLVQGAIDRLMRDRTVLVVAHRLTTVRHADEILVIDRGRLVERGTHQALLARNGLYRRLHDLQFQAVEAPA